MVVKGLRFNAKNLPLAEGRREVQKPRKAAPCLKPMP